MDDAVLKITGGTFCGRNLHSPKGLETRPTAARIRQSVFDILINSTKGFPELSSARVLDLYAGTGAMGFEALSRGAGEVVFVDSSRRATRSIKQNIQELKVGEFCKVLSCGVFDALQNMEAGRKVFDFVFMDPPYAANKKRRMTIERLMNLSILSSGACVIVEGPSRWCGGRDIDECLSNNEFPQLDEVCFRKWGDTNVRFFLYV